MSRRIVLFDLDGTLTDPAEGIIGGVRHALVSAGLPVPDRATLESFIGPPLIAQFTAVCGVTEPQARALLSAYRDYFVPRGMWENRVYPGIPDMLDALHAAGLTCAVTTSKPEPFAVQILDHFGLSSRFACICGSTLDETRTGKDAVITYALSRLSAAPADAVMVGDRCYDVQGARACGLPCIGVLYGYGSREELCAAGAAALAASPEQLTAMLTADTGEF